MIAALSVTLAALHALAPAAPPAAAALFEGRCGYCHSAARVTSLRMSRSQWRKVVRQMQARAPLLIGRGEVEVLVRYLVNDLKLVPPEAPRRAATGTVAPVPLAPPVELEAPPSEDLVSPAPPAEPEPPPEDAEAEALGPALLADRCSKCHTLNRVFTKIDSLAAGEAIIHRMRKKTGSGISPDDAQVLLRFLASRAGR